jgi:hypothetical protein
MFKPKGAPSKLRLGRFFFGDRNSRDLIPWRQSFPAQAELGRGTLVVATG